MARGKMTDKIQEIANAFLKRDITTRELRLYAYLHYVMINHQYIEPKRINQEEREILTILKKEGHIEGGAGGLAITREFYDYMCEILWWGYVVGGSNDH